MSKEMFSVLGDLETISVEIKTAMDALAVYESAMEDNLDAVDGDKPHTVAVALHNCKLNAAVLQLARQKLAACRQDMAAAIDKGYTVVRSADPAGK